jgi:hypothetical protein
LPLVIFANYLKRIVTGTFGRRWELIRGGKYGAASGVFVGLRLLAPLAGRDDIAPAILTTLRNRFAIPVKLMS